MHELLAQLGNAAINFLYVLVNRTLEFSSFAFIGYCLIRNFIDFNCILKMSNLIIFLTER